ncbi:MAG: hypothetical protein DRO11_09600 [Methanobacteriota archaeon]|nr:MAG: hypothetical protein DRO11_09600 [Euryarchaeota archaeon]
MKDFVIKDFDRFLEIADTINTPFKFVELKDSDVGKNFVLLQAKVWMRTAYLTYEKDVPKNKLSETVQVLKRHGFTEAEIRETAFPVR